MHDPDDDDGNMTDGVVLALARFAYDVSNNVEHVCTERTQNANASSSFCTGDEGCASVSCLRSARSLRWSLTAYIVLLGTRGAPVRRALHGGCCSDVRHRHVVTCFWTSRGTSCSVLQKPRRIPTHDGPRSCDHGLRQESTWQSRVLNATFVRLSFAQNKAVTRRAARWLSMLVRTYDSKR